MMARDTRNRIVDVAARLFHEQGYAATAVASVLDEAEVNSGSLYHFFAGKEALVVAVVAEHLERLDPEILDPVEDAVVDPFERVDALLGVYRDRLAALGSAGGSPVGKLAVELAGQHPEVRRLADRYFATLQRRIRSWLDAAGNRLPADVDRTSLAGFIVTVLEGALHRSRIAGSIEGFDESTSVLRSCLALLADQAHRDRIAREEGWIAAEAEEPSVRRQPSDRAAWRSW
jgi:AcrR family transcriptional regulator